MQNNKKLAGSASLNSLQKEIKYKISTTMAKVAAISDTVVVSATSLGVGVWQDDTNLYQARIPEREALLIS